MYATTQPGYAQELRSEALREGDPPPRFYCVTDGNRWQWWRLALQFFQLAALLLRERPDVVVSTGAAPGILALRLGKLFGARTAWVDSIANAHELSLSGRMAGSCADLWLTQWAHLEGSVDPARGRPGYEGKVTSFS